MRISITGYDEKQLSSDPKGRNVVLLNLSGEPDLHWIGFFFENHQLNPNSYKPSVEFQGAQMRLTFTYHIVQQVVDTVKDSTEKANSEYAKLEAVENAMSQMAKEEEARRKQQQKTNEEKLRQQMKNLKLD